MVWGFIAGFLVRTVTPGMVQLLAGAGISSVLIDKVTNLLNPTIAMTDLTTAETDQIKAIAATTLSDDAKATLIAKLLNVRDINWTTVSLYITIVIIVILIAYLILKRK